MGRPPRIDLPDSFHHIWHRGAAQLPIFLDDDDSEWFIAEAEQTAEDFDWSVLSYALMRNHFHLLIKTREATLSSGMQRFGLRHARYNHARHGSAGHLFDAPFGQAHVTNDPYLINILKYIAANPVHAGLCDEPADYRWSAHRALLHDRQGAVAHLLEGIGNITYADLFGEHPPFGAHWRDVADPRPSVPGLLREYGRERGLAIARDTGHTLQELADATGLSVATLSRRLK